MKKRPEGKEYHPYFEKYVKLVPKGNIVEILEKQNKETMYLFNGYSNKQGLYRYSPGKWSIKEVIGHLIDTE